MHKLERLILEAFSEVKEEEQEKENYGLRENFLKLLRDSIEKRYGVSKWPEKDFVSSEYANIL